MRHTPRRRERRLDSAAPTIRDVAQRAKVATSTVSRALAGHKGVSQGVRERINRVAQFLGYQPSRVARSLRAGNSLMVGVVVPDMQNPFFTGVMRGIEDVLNSAGYTLLLANSDEDPQRERATLLSLRSEGVAGIVFVPINTKVTTYKYLLKPPMPMVAVDRLPVGLKVDLVTVANIEGARNAVEHLIAMGHVRIGLVNGPEQHSTAKERREGYEQALAFAGIPIRTELIQHGDFREGGGNLAMKALLALPERPTAAFVSNNLMTLGALQAIHETGLAIPSDLALVGFDDMAWAASLNPPLTAVAQPEREIGATAAQLLLTRIREPDKPIRHVVLQTRLTVRASCGFRTHLQRVGSSARASRTDSTGQSAAATRRRRP